MSCACSGHINKTWAIYFCAFQYLCIFCYKILDICGNLRLLLFMGMKYSHFHFTILQSSWSKGISEMRLKHQNPCSSACIGLWYHRLMHAPHRLMHECAACIAPWCHRLMHAVTASALLFWFHHGYTFISSWFDYFMLNHEVYLMEEHTLDNSNHSQ